MPETLFRWVHISDIHIGHGDATNVWDQKMVLDELKRDLALQIKVQPDPPVDAILVTGDIGNTGAGRRADEYERAAAWLAQVSEAAGVPSERVFLVPGNHDVNRGVDADANVKQLVHALREGTTSLDAALAAAPDREILVRRMEKYLAFASAFAPVGVGDRLTWVHSFIARSGLSVRLVGLNTALLAAGDDDFGKLRVGMGQIAQALVDVKDSELVLALAHHPLDWLADRADIEPYLKRRVHALLSGHVHEANAEELRSGGGGSFLRVVAGSAHGDKMPPGVPAGHGYSFGAVVRGDDGAVSVRLMPRKWSAKNASFRPDMDNIPEARTFSEHALPASLSRSLALSLSTPTASGSPATTSERRAAAQPASVKVVSGEPVPVFISSAPKDDALREELQDHMAMLRRQKKAVFTSSQDVPSGVSAKEWIAGQIAQARIILLLISKDYIAADAYYEDELLRAIVRHDKGEARVIPILLRNFSISDEPFAKLQALPRRGGPVDKNADGVDGALAAIAHEVAKVVADMRGETLPVSRYR